MEKLPDEDLEEVREEAERVAAGRPLDWEFPTLCLGPYSASIELEAPDEIRPDGSTVTTEVSCSRGPHPWECQLGSYRAMEMKLDGGNRSDIVLLLPMDFDVLEARTLLQQVADLAPTLNLTHECSYDPAVPRDPGAEEFERQLRRNFSFPADYEYAQPIVGIRDESGWVKIDVDSLALRYEKNTAVSGGLEFRCWTRHAGWPQIPR